MAAALRIILSCVLIHSIASNLTKDRIAYYFVRHSDGKQIKIETNPPSSSTSDWTLEETFYAFPYPVDYCIPITVYDHPSNDGHGITQYGDENILFWFFAYPDMKLIDIHLSLSWHDHALLFTATNLCNMPKQQSTAYIWINQQKQSGFPKLIQLPLPRLNYYFHSMHLRMTVHFISFDVFIEIFTC